MIYRLERKEPQRAYIKVEKAKAYALKPDTIDTDWANTLINRELSCIYRFENDSDLEFFIGSADWMRRNLDRRMETIMPVTDPKLKQELEQTLRVYENDNCSAWDMQPDGKYVQRCPRQDEERRAAQEVFIEVISRQSKDRKSNHAQ